MTSVSFLAVVLLASMSTVVSQGAPGPFCAGRYCLKGQAKCVDNKTCECINPPFTQGPRGALGCYYKNQVRAEVFNDPTISTFTKEDVRFQYPCRYLLAAVKQQLKKKNGQIIGSCEFQAHAFQGRSRGKFYAEGIEIAIKLNYNNGSSKASSSIVYGTNGSVKTNATDNAFLPDGPSYDNDVVNYADTPNNIFIKWSFNPDTQQYIFEALACGLRATFVPYNVATGISSPFLPGITVAINCVYHPKWLLIHESMGLDPQHNVSYVLNQYPGLNAEQAFLVRAFTRNVPQTQPNASPLCSAVSSSLNKCNNTERVKALNVCSFVFDTPPFTRCVAQGSSNSNPVIDLFDKCVRKICNNENVCAQVQALVVPGGCNIPGGTAWNQLNSTVCS